MKETEVKKRGLRDNPVVTLIRKPLVGMYEIGKNSVKNFFADAPSRAFFKRLALGIGGLALFGATLLIFPMGLDVTKVAALTLLQIPLGIYQKDATKIAKNILDKVKKTRSKPLKVAAGGALLTLGAVLAISPVGRTFAKNIVKMGIEKFALPLIRIPLKQFKRQATRAVQNDDNSETLDKLFSSKGLVKLSDEEATSKKNEILKLLSLMNDPQRQEFFDGLCRGFRTEFTAAATRTPVEALPAALESDVKESIFKGTPAAPAGPRRSEKGSYIKRALTER